MPDPFAIHPTAVGARQDFVPGGPSRMAEDAMNKIFESIQNAAGTVEQADVNLEKTYQDLQSKGFSGTQHTKEDIAMLGEMSEVLPVAGILKPQGIANALAQTSRFFSGKPTPMLSRDLQGLNQMLEDMLRMKQREFSRFNDIRMDPTLNAIGEVNAQSYVGESTPFNVDMTLNPLFLDDISKKGTVFHEFAHGRQHRPEFAESSLVGDVQKARKDVLDRQIAGEITPETAYAIDPTERQARDLAEKMTTKRELDFEQAWKTSLLNQLRGIIK